MRLYWLLTRASSGYKLKNKRQDSVRLVCISDTHSSHNLVPPLPDGDILIHAGDMTQYGTFEEADAVFAWINAQKHPHKIIIAGNHEIVLMDLNRRAELLAKYPNLTFLQDESTLVPVRGRVLRFYGHAQVSRHGTPAFTHPRVHPRDAASAAPRLWPHVPEYVDVLVTHGPPAFHLDGFMWGCPALLHVLWRLRPAVHVFGHIHNGRGVERLRWTPAQAAYERICAGMGGVLDLLEIGKAYVKTLVWGPEETGNSETILANVSSKLEWNDGVIRPARIIDI